MSKNHFERHIQQTLFEAEVQPGEEIWEALEARLVHERRRPLSFWLWLGGLSVLAILGGFLLLPLGDMPHMNQLPTTTSEAPMLLKQSSSDSIGIALPTTPPRPRPTNDHEVIPSNIPTDQHTPLRPIKEGVLNAVGAYELESPLLPMAVSLRVSGPMAKTQATDIGTAYVINKAFSWQVPLPPIDDLSHRRLRSRSSSIWLGLQFGQEQVGQVLKQLPSSEPMVSSALEDVWATSRFVAPERAAVGRTLTFPQQNQSLSLQAIWSINRWIELETGLGYQKAVGGQYEEKTIPARTRPKSAVPLSLATQPITSSTTFTEESWTIPVNVHARLPLGRFAIALKTGLGFNLMQQQQIATPETVESFQEPLPSFRASYLQANGGLELQYQFSPTLRLVAGPNLAYYLSSPYQQVEVAPRYRGGVKGALQFRIK